jgi:hypothetical protein
MLSSLFSVVCCVREMPVCDMRVMPGLHMVAGFVMLRGFTVVLCRVLVVLGCLMMMRRAGVIRHGMSFSFVNLIIHQSQVVIK